MRISDWSSDVCSSDLESLLSYEAGFRASLLDRRVQLSGAAFYYDYRDKQLIGWANTAFGPLPQLVNIPKSRVVGAELEITAQPVVGLRVNADVTYIDTQEKKAPAPPLDKIVREARR